MASLQTSLRLAASRFASARTSTMALRQLPCAMSSARNHSAVAGTQESAYVSPFQDMFTRMKTTPDVSTLKEITGFEYQGTPEHKILECGIPESVLRFTTTTYGRLMNAPYVHAREHSVVLKVNFTHLPLNDLESAILKDIVGTRYNEERRELRLRSDQFGSRIENKRHLVTMLDRLILSCKRVAQEITENAVRDGEVETAEAA